jgi:poly [ADP-ribose] polymerase
VLGDIEIAQSLQDKINKGARVEAGGKVDHPYDKNYATLKCDLTPVLPGTELFDIIETYVKNTKGRQVQLLDVWECDRQNEDKRFAAHDQIENRRLLWHGTNVAVVAAILSSGLRIMPHSGGRVGRGIYLASENGKSAGYGQFFFFFFFFFLSINNFTSFS